MSIFGKAFSKIKGAAGAAKIGAASAGRRGFGGLKNMAARIKQGAGETDRSPSGLPTRKPTNFLGRKLEKGQMAMDGKAHKFGRWGAKGNGMERAADAARKKAQAGGEGGAKKNRRHDTIALMKSGKFGRRNASRWGGGAGDYRNAVETASIRGIGKDWKAKIKEQMEARRAKKRASKGDNKGGVSALVNKISADAAAKIAPGLDQAAQGGGAPPAGADAAPPAAPPPAAAAPPPPPPPAGDDAAPPAPGMRRGGVVKKKGVKRMFGGGMGAGLGQALQKAMAQRGQAPQAARPVRGGFGGTAQRALGGMGQAIQRMMQQRQGQAPQQQTARVPQSAWQQQGQLAPQGPQPPQAAAQIQPQPGMPMPGMGGMGNLMGGAFGQIAQRLQQQGQAAPQAMRKGGAVKAKKGWEGSAKDEAQDKKLAKKYGMSMSKWEKSSMDAKHDSQKSAKGLARGGGIESRGKTRGTVVRMASGGAVGSASRRADGIASRGRTKCKIR